jgi:organic hydroperoxide reductase OsmC/OhrA
MSHHVARVRWSRGDHPFTYDEYCRDHVWSFDSGITVAASASPVYLGGEHAVDPEEAFVASVSSCHMLTFLAIAARKRLVIDAYVDRAVGELAENSSGRLAVTRIVLSPVIGWAGDAPDEGVLARMHELAHQDCFIANSVTTEIVVGDPVS